MAVESFSKAKLTRVLRELTGTERTIEHVTERLQIKSREVDEERERIMHAQQGREKLLRMRERTVQVMQTQTERVRGQAHGEGGELGPQAAQRKESYMRTVGDAIQLMRDIDIKVTRLDSLLKEDDTVELAREVLQWQQCQH